MSRRVLSRRRFLAVVGGAGSSLALAGSAGAERALSASEPQRAPNVSTPATVPGARVAQVGDPGGERGPVAVNVKAGFVDATSWTDQLLTLRSGGPSGMLVRSELLGRDYPVTVPEGFAGRCLGSWGGSVVIGGHRVVNTGSFTFEAGEAYETLLAQAGDHARVLVAQPGRPVVTPYRHVFVERFPAVLVTSDLTNWQHLDVPLSVGTGGSFGAVLERGGVLAADHYAVAEVPDSVFEASLVTLAGAVGGEASAARGSIPVDHGGLWGASDTGSSDLVIVSDRAGTRGYDGRNRGGADPRRRRGSVGGRRRGRSVRSGGADPRRHPPHRERPQRLRQAGAGSVRHRADQTPGIANCHYRRLRRQARPHTQHHHRPRCRGHVETQVRGNISSERRTGPQPFLQEDSRNATAGCLDLYLLGANCDRSQ